MVVEILDRDVVREEFRNLKFLRGASGGEERCDEQKRRR